MKIYLAGRITGDPDYKAKFEKAAAGLKGEGHIPLNPAVLPEGMTTADYMRICTAMIDRADMVAFLPDWTESKGALLERQYCLYTGKLVEYWEANNETQLQLEVTKGAI